MTKRQGSEPNSACGKRCVHTVAGTGAPASQPAQLRIFRSLGAARAPVRMVPRLARTVRSGPTGNRTSAKTPTPAIWASPGNRSRAPPPRHAPRGARGAGIERRAPRGSVSPKRSEIPGARSGTHRHHLSSPGPASLPQRRRGEQAGTICTRPGDAVGPGPGSRLCAPGHGQSGGERPARQTEWNHGNRGGFMRSAEQITDQTLSAVTSGPVWLCMWMSSN